MANLKNDNNPQASNHSLVTKGIWIILRQMGMKVVISVCVCVSHSVISNSLGPCGLLLIVYLLLCPRDSPGKNTGVGCHFLLQGIFLTQELNLSLPLCRQTLYRLNHEESF